MRIRRILTGLVILVDISPVLQVFYKIAHAVFVIRKLILLVQLVHPLQGLAHIAVRIAEELHEHVQQLFEFGFTVLVGIVAFEMKPYHIYNLQIKNNLFYDLVRPERRKAGPGGPASMSGNRLSYLAGC